MSPRTAELDIFFPLPSQAPSNKAPLRLAGFSHKSGEALAKVLQDNHVKWHAFFNDLGFHKLVSFSLLSSYECLSLRALQSCFSPPRCNLRSRRERSAH